MGDVQVPDVFDAATFAALVEREHEHLELKTGAGVGPLQRSLVALSNSGGGTLLIGVADDRTVVGQELTQGIDDRVRQAERAAHDVGRLTVREVRVGDRAVVAVDVAARLEGFAQTSEGVVLVRRGGHNVALVGRDLSDFLREHGGVAYDSSPSPLRWEDADEDVVAEVARTLGWTDDDPEARPREMGLLLADGRLSIAGALLLTDPSRSMHQFKWCIDVRRYESTRSPDYVTRRELFGPVQRQVRAATDLVMHDIGSDLVTHGSAAARPAPPPGAGGPGGARERRRPPQLRLRRHACRLRGPAGPRRGDVAGTLARACHRGDHASGAATPQQPGPAGPPSSRPRGGRRARHRRHRGRPARRPPPTAALRGG